MSVTDTYRKCDSILHLCLCTCVAKVRKDIYILQSCHGIFGGDGPCMASSTFVMTRRSETTQPLDRLLSSN